MVRGYEHLLHSYLATFPCVALLGVRQCGKTTLLRTLPPKWKQLDLERRADHAVVSRDPDAFFRLNPRHVALDEAQVLPDLFPALRVAIDEHRTEKGRFVITGSSSPALVRSVSESLAGRVGIIEMVPFSWEEADSRSPGSIPRPRSALGGLSSTFRPISSATSNGCFRASTRSGSAVFSKCWGGCPAGS